MSDKRIVVVDDDATFLALMEDILHEAGYQARLLPATAASVAAIQASQPDLVILDLWLTGPDTGLRLLAALREQELTRSIPVLVSSADHQGLRAHQAWLRQQRAAILPKPFELDEALACVANLVSRPLASAITP